MSDDVLTSSYCTAWASFNTPRLWAMVKDEDDAVGRAQVSAWRTLAGSVRAQREALRTARADLVAAWPEENASAAAFLAELDTLIKRLDTASADAETTANGLDRIMNALQTAKKQIEPIWEKYKDKSDDLVPRWFDSAEDELDEQARQAMITAEKAVQDSVPMLKVPDPYRLNVDDEEHGLRPLPGEGAGSARASGFGSGGGGLSVAVPHDPVPPLPGRDPIVPEGAGPGIPVGGGIGGGDGAAVVGGGPDLAGVINPSPPTTLPGGGATGPLPGGGAPLPVTGGGGAPGPIVPGLLPGGLGVGGIPPGGTAGRGVRPNGGLGRAPFGGPGGAPGGRVANGVLGAPMTGPLGGVGAPGGRPAAARGGAPGRPGTTPGPRPAWLPNDPVGPNRHAMAPGAVGGAAGARRQRADGEQPRFDPDNPWRVAEGVRPVITPAPDHARHDPGPNVIGRRG